MFFRRKGKAEPEAQPSSAQGQEAEAGASAERILRDEVGLYHLWYLELRMREELARGGRTGQVFSLATWQLRLLPGEVPSDELFRQAAEHIGNSLRAYDVYARIDEHRFVAILFDAPFESASTVAFRIKGDLQVRVQSAGRWQAGVAAFPVDGVDGNSLIQAAFRRLDEDSRAA